MKPAASSNKVIQAVCSVDGRLHYSQGTTGDLLAFCNECMDSPVPVAEIYNTRDGPTVIYRRLHYGYSASTMVGVTVRCKAGHEAQIFFKEVMGLLEKIAQSRTTKTKPTSDCQ
jgi:hypothetical protein